MDIVSQLCTQSHTGCQLTVYILSMLLAKSRDFTKSHFFLLIPEIVVDIDKEQDAKEGRHAMVYCLYSHFMLYLNVKGLGNFKFT